MKKYFGIVTLCLGVMSCEKVIEVPLNEADQEIVVEAVGRNFEGESFVKLSRTGTVYEDGGFEKISDATVTLTDKDGVVTTFEEVDGVPGYYTAADFMVTPNNQYDLSVNVGGEVLTSVSSSFTKPTLDSLSYFMQVGGAFGGEPTDTTFLVFYNFTDNGAEENFYRFQLWINGEADENFYIGDDRLGNGQQVSAPFFASDIGSKDTVFVELQSMDEATYDYLFTLSSNLNSGGPFTAVPANPVSNIEGGIGYFGAYMIDTMTLIMP